MDHCCGKAGYECNVVLIIITIMRIKIGLLLIFLAGGPLLLKARGDQTFLQRNLFLFLSLQNLPQRSGELHWEPRASWSLFPKTGKFNTGGLVWSLPLWASGHLPISALQFLRIWDYLYASVCNVGLSGTKGYGQTGSTGGVNVPGSHNKRSDAHGKCSVHPSCTVITFT